MYKLAMLLFLCCPALLIAQADTVRIGHREGNLLTDDSNFDCQPTPLYEYNWVKMTRLPANAWQTRRNRELIFPASSKAVALRFWIKNETEKEQHLVFEMDDLQMDHAKIWVQKQDNQIDSSRLSGDLMPFHHRDLAFANPNFNIKLHAGETVTVWAYMDQSGLFLRPRLGLWTIDAFVGYASRRQLRAGLVLGLFILSALVFVLVALFRILPVAKWYAGFIGIQTIQIVIQLGIGHQFLWPESGRWTTFMAIVFPLMGFFLLFKLLVVLLDLKNRLPNWYRLLRNGMIGLWGCAIVSYLIYLSGVQKPLVVLYPFGMLVAIGVCVLMIMSCLRTWQKFRETKSLLFLLAFSCGIAGAVFSWLTKMGFPVDFEMSRYSVVAGFTFDLLIFNYLISRNLWQTKTRNHSLQLALAEASREASVNLLRGQEEERKRLSMDLHDGVGIELGSIRRRLETLFLSQDSKASVEAQQIVGELANVAEQIRKFSHALDPFSAKNLSLPDLLDNLLFDFENNSPGVSVNYEKNTSQMEGELVAGSLSDNEKHLFFIAAELLNNISRHAHASEVNLSIAYFLDKMVLEIVDNGIGYSPTSTLAGVGLNHIQSRAQLSGARFMAVSKPPRGMLHWVEMPFQAPQQSNGLAISTAVYARIS